MYAKTLITSIVALTPALALTAPLPRPRVEIDCLITARNAPIGAHCPNVLFKATRHRDGLPLQRDGGRDSAEVLLGNEIHGDFIANLEVEVAGFRALGIRPNGGTPVPYFGFRTSTGKDAEYFTLHTVMAGWETFTMEIRRKGNQVTANRGGHEFRSSVQDCAGPGYILFLMNDVAKLKVLRCDVRVLPAADPFVVRNMR